MNRTISRKRVAAALALFSNVLFAPALALAQNEPKPIYDARLEGYAKSVTLDGGSTALIWLLLIVLSALVVGVMFKNANRSHLD